MKSIFKLISLAVSLFIINTGFVSCQYKEKDKTSTMSETMQTPQTTQAPVAESTAVPEKPAAHEIINKLKEKSKNNAHPRLMATAQDFERIKSQISSDKHQGERFSYIKQKADAILNQSPVIYELPDGIRLLSVSRNVLNRVQILSFVYRISGEKKYADRAWLELQTVSGKNPDPKHAFNDWHPAHFLDTAEMTAAAAIGYDWLYDYLSAEQRSVISNAIYEYGLKQTSTNYFRSKEKVTNNWNAVCNGGIGLGALSVADEGGEIEALAGKILEGAIKNLPIMIKKYGPDGGWYEGPGYWDYASTFTSYFISALDSSLGTDYGLSKIPGLSASGDFPLFLNGPKGSFNFADSGIAGTFKSPVILYMANKFNKPEYNWYYNKVSGPKDSSVMEFIWANWNINDTEPRIQDKYFRSVEVAALHSSFMNPQEMYVGFKAGENGLDHGDLDLGSFIFDANGVRWIYDLGSENYNVPGYWNMGKFGQRWTYYRKRAEGHNTLVINPSSIPDQNATAKTKFENFKEDSRISFAIADLTDAYKTDASSVKRGIRMDKEKQFILIQDEITALKPSDIWWFANTQASIELDSDKKSATLSKDGKKLKVQLVSPSNAVFEVMRAEPLSTSPNPKGQTINTTQKLAIHLNDLNETTISVSMAPLAADGKDTVGIPEIVPLKDWK